MKLVMSGMLYPQDGLSGTVFKVFQYTDSKDTYFVKLISASTKEKLDEAILPYEKVGSWLLERRDW